MKNIVIAAFVACLAIATSGCASLADAQAAKGTGEVRSYAKPYEVVWPAVVNAVGSSGLDVVSEDQSSGKILAKGGMTAFSYGEKVAIFVEPDSLAGNTSVEIVNKRALATNVTATDWSHKIFKALDMALQ